MSSCRPGFVVVCSLCFGCSSEATDPGNPAAGAGGSSGASAGASGSSGAPLVCDDGPGYGEPTPSREVSSVSAVLIDQDGLAVADEQVQVCGIDLCSAIGATTASGGVRFSIVPAQALKKAAFKFGEGKASARFAWLLPDQPEIDLGTVRTVLLPPIGTGALLAPGKSAESGGLTLTPPAHGSIKIDKLTFRKPEEQLLRATRVELSQAPAVVDPELGFEIVYAATPVDTLFCPPAALSIENSENWAPGTQVEVWLHGVAVEEEWAPYGGWAQVSEAEVSADGNRIATTGAGLPLLGVLGFKRR